MIGKLPPSLQPYALVGTLFLMLAASFLWHRRKGMDLNRSLALGAFKTSLVFSLALAVSALIR